MIGDPTVTIRQSALAFLQSLLLKLLVLDNDTPMEEFEGSSWTAVNFDKLLQSLVTTMEHPNPFVRQVAMYWMSRIVKAHIGEGVTTTTSTTGATDDTNNEERGGSEDGGGGGGGAMNASKHESSGRVVQHRFPFKIRCHMSCGVFY
jgi:hypothetical protein